ncbi:hypothetical protein D3C86_1774640 [compost metagenome]
MRTIQRIESRQAEDDFLPVSGFHHHLRAAHHGQAQRDPGTLQGRSFIKDQPRGGQSETRQIMGEVGFGNVYRTCDYPKVVALTQANDMVALQAQIQLAPIERNDQVPLQHARRVLHPRQQAFQRITGHGGVSS